MKATRAMILNRITDLICIVKRSCVNAQDELSYPPKVVENGELPQQFIDAGLEIRALLKELKTAPAKWADAIEKKED